MAPDEPIETTSIDLSEISKRSLDSFDVAPPAGDWTPIEPSASLQPMSEPGATGASASAGPTQPSE